MTAPGILDRLNDWIGRREKIIFVLAPMVLPLGGAMAYRYLVIDDVTTRVAVIENQQKNTTSDVTDLLTFECLKTPIDSLRQRGLFHMVARCTALIEGR